MDITFQILVAAAIIFGVWKISKYVQWRIAVVKFARFETSELPHSTPEEQAKSMKLALELIGKMARGLPKAKRDEMLQTKSPTDTPAAQMLFAMLRTIDAIEKGELKPDAADSYFRMCAMLYWAAPKD